MPNLILLQCLGVVLAPLVSAIGAGFFKKQLGIRGTSILAVLGVGISFLLSLLIFNQMAFTDHYPQGINMNLYHWAVVGHVTFNIGFLIDRLSALMMVVVTFVSWMVHIYTIGYMKGDPGYQRFFSYISLFTFSMLMLVMANNALQLFFGWEAVGLMSYLLIGFWFKRESAIVANLKAFLVNRVGDFGFLLGIAGLLSLFNTLDYATIFQLVPMVVESSPLIYLTETFSVSAITLTCILLFIGAMGKSAQVPLHVWLPDSMEGPTPISALIHAATMVTAGVFMLARFSPLFEYSDVALNMVLIIGALTAFSMGLIAIVTHDIKRIIAYSTLSQLGYMMVGAASSAYAAAIFHLMTHAFFKALLFLGAGSVIIAMHHEQDIRKMGGLRKYMPITYGCMLVATLAIVGFPFFSGFYSKDLIIESVKASQLPAANFAYFCVASGVLVTAIYSFRLLFVVFHGTPRMDAHTQAELKESPKVIWGPLVALAIPSLFAGMLFLEPLASNFFKNAIVVLPAHGQAALFFHFHLLHSIPFWCLVCGFISAWVAYIRFPHLPAYIANQLHPLYRILMHKYGFDAFNRKVVVRGVREIAHFCSDIGDKKIIDGILVNGLANSIGQAAQAVRKIQSGYLYHYVLAMISGLLILLVWLIL